ncbi:MAG TPA: Uma2 family endonuclease [Bryobacteraceae bacterium]|nr:Uma2 family endonuclease [Bryobacteraceae bacterium]
MSAHPHRLSPEEYLALDRAAEVRSEYYNGQMYAMSGGSLNHGVIINNTARALGNLLEDRPCLVVSNDLRVRINPNLYTYPDIVVICGKPQFAGDRQDIILNPLVLFEVLSPSTERYDRGFKSAQYRTVTSLMEHVLVSQSEPRIEVYRRQPGGAWLFSEWTGLDATCRLDSLECDLPLSTVYKNIDFTANASEERL